MISADAIERCKEGVIIVNAARGPMVDEAAVADALRSGRIAGYAADVVSVEPMLPDNPLKDAPNTVITPHTAWAPMETRVRLIEVAADNLKAYLAGSPVNVVN
jgi:glycerate dehydrogenase